MSIFMLLGIMLQIYYILLNAANDKSVFQKIWKDIFNLYYCFSLPG